MLRATVQLSKSDGRVKAELWVPGANVGGEGATLKQALEGLTGALSATDEPFWIDESLECTRVFYGSGREVKCEEPYELLCNRCGEASCESHMQGHPIYEDVGPEKETVCEDCLTPEESAAL